MKLATLEKDPSLLLLKCISGSRAYGLSTPQSDTDLKGVFVLPQAEFYGLEYTEQVSNATNDEVFYELKRFIDLLSKNNPNILELLATPEDCILYRHPLMDQIRQEMFLSKLCKQTFAGYAQSQIKKAKGLNKKIVNPMEVQRKSILDFCFILQGHGSVSLDSWLKQNNWRQEDCGLVKIPHMRDMFAVFHNSQMNEKLHGISSGESANDITLSSIPKNIEPLAVMSFNKDSYSTHCKDYNAYWHWVENRNETRYENTRSHGKNYDAKNMMHTFRLLNMAEEIAQEHKIQVRRFDRDFLLDIKAGNFEYEDLVSMANEKIERIDTLYDRSDLPEAPDPAQMENLLVTLRTLWYQPK